MFSKAVLTVKDLVMPTGLRRRKFSNHGRKSNDLNNIDRSRTQNVPKQFFETVFCK